VIAIEVAARDTERQKALQAAGVSVHRVQPDAVPEELFPPRWDAQSLPTSPFRRAMQGDGFRLAQPILRPGMRTA